MRTYDTFGVGPPRLSNFRARRKIWHAQGLVDSSASPFSYLDKSSRVGEF
jgi:hypothetical protein